MLRNTSARGYSKVDLDILGCEISPLSEDTTITGREPIVIDPEIFASFRPWSGWVPSGFFADWTGILTRVDVWAFNEKQLAVFNRYRHESHSVRLDWEHILDWAPLAQAVNESIGTFRMVALGAGLGSLARRRRCTRSADWGATTTCSESKLSRSISNGCCGISRRTKFRRTATPSSPLPPAHLANAGFQ